MDANEKGEEDRRRGQFKKWLLNVWEWADEQGKPIADDIAELISHVDEVDYPLWGMAAKRGVTGDGEQATYIRRRFGSPPSGPKANEWEKQINYAPVIYLDEQTWRSIHGQLAWVNRDHDTKLTAPNFWLWSNAANVVRFVMRRKEDLDALVRSSDHGEAD